MEKKASKNLIAKDFQAVVIGASAGGFNALEKLFSLLDSSFALPVIVVQHISPDQDTQYTLKHYSEVSGRKVKEADEKEKIEAKTIYLAPPSYHLLIENDYSFSLSVEERINYSRPSIDLLFTSAAEVYFDKLLGIILTGANSDGTAGCAGIKANGGTVIAQDPEEAQSSEMPASAIRKVKVDQVMKIEDIAKYLNKLKN